MDGAQNEVVVAARRADRALMVAPGRARPRPCGSAFLLLDLLAVLLVLIGDRAGIGRQRLALAAAGKTPRPRPKPATLSTAPRLSPPTPRPPPTPTPRSRSELARLHPINIRILDVRQIE